MADRPPHVKPPAYLSANPPVPAPESVAPRRRSAKGDSDAPDPTRYGDWVDKGIAIDF